MKNRTNAFVAAALLVTTACATAGRDTAIGAGAGAAAGAGVGALAGGSVGLYLDKQRKELEAIAETKKNENGSLTTNLAGDILFDSGSAVLKPEAVTKLEKIGDIIAKYSDDRVRIEGHTDSQGSKATNEELSLRRASAVKAVLVGRGVKDTQITALGMGEDHPVADNKTADGRQKNRRVELHIDVPQPS